MERKETVVVVDDDREIRTVIEIALKKPGRTIVGFGDGQEALEFLARSDDVDLVVSDVAMEGFDGHRLLRHLRSNARTASTSVIFVTAADGAETRFDVVGERAVEHLRKPFDVAELRSRADGAIQRRENSATPRDPETGLHTRAHFESLLATALRDAPSDGSPLALMFGDLESLDGGAALPRVATIIGMHLRATDFAARVGANAFATVHPSCDASGATVIAQRILRAVSGDPQCAGVSIRLGLAVTATPRETQPEALVAAADEALHAEKRIGEAPLTLRTL
jgi:two-component system, cell cycle response regulator